MALPARGDQALGGATPAIVRQRSNAAFKKKYPGKKKGSGTPGSSSMFPDTSVSSRDMAAILRNAKSSASSIYNTVPLPKLATYQQPFIDAANHEAKLGQDMLAAIGGAAQYSQGLTSGLSSWLQQNVGTAAQEAQSAGGGTAVPSYTTAAQAAVPVQSYGTSQTQYLNSLAPYVAGSSQEYQRNITKQQALALRDYNEATQTRQSDVAKSVQDLYDKNLSTLTTSRQNVAKNAIAEYIALTAAGMKADAATEKVRVDTARIIADQRSGDIAQQNADASSSRASTAAWKAKHPTVSAAAAGKAGTALQKALKAANSEYKKPLGKPSPLQNFTRQVKISYDQPGSYGSAPTVKTATATWTVPTGDPNDPEITRQFNAWKAKFPGFTSPRLTDKGSPIARTVPGASIKNYPGQGTNWQNALTVFVQQMAATKKPSETPQQFRSRMAKLYAGYQPRPKAKK